MCLRLGFRAVKILCFGAILLYEVRVCGCSNSCNAGTHVLFPFNFDGMQRTMLTLWIRSWKC
jgi:hypothetical protein